MTEIVESARRTHFTKPLTTASMIALQVITSLDFFEENVWDVAAPPPPSPLFDPCIKITISQRLEETNFIFSCKQIQQQQQCFAHSLRLLKKYCFFPVENKKHIFPPPCRSGFRCVNCYLTKQTFCFITAKRSEFGYLLHVVPGVGGRGRDVSRVAAHTAS